MSTSVIAIADVRPVHAISLSASSEPRARALLAVGEYLRERGYRFTAVTPLTHARVNARTGNAQAHDLDGIFGWSRPFSAAVPGPVLLDLMYNAAIVDTDDASLRCAVRVSSLDGGLYMHSAWPTSGADAVFFGPDTYRFVRALKTALQGRVGKVFRAVDVGCGSGAAAVTMARAFPSATVYAADINGAALALVEVNARLARIENVIPVHSDLLAGLHGVFDLIVANPPYLLDRDEHAYRHGGGDFGEGLSLRIVNEAIERLAPNGTLMLYTGSAIIRGADPFKLAVESRLREAGFRWVYEEIDPDVFGEELETPGYVRTDRIAAVWLCATRA